MPVRPPPLPPENALPAASPLEPAPIPKDTSTKGIIIVYHSPVPDPNIPLTTPNNITTIIKQGIDLKILIIKLNIEFNHLQGIIPFLEVTLSKIPIGRPKRYAKPHEINVIPRVSKIILKISEKLTCIHLLIINIFKF